MTRYYDREQALFKEWKERFVVNGISEDLFAEDGLLFRGRIIYVNETGCWDREQGNEAELWDTAPKRLLVLTKDLYDDEPWDVRIETGRKKGSELPVLHNYFYPNLLFIKFSTNIVFRWLHWIISCKASITISMRTIYQLI